MTAQGESQPVRDTIIGWIQLVAIIAIIVIGISVSFMLSGGGTARPEAPVSTAVPVRIITPERTSHTLEIGLTGTVAARAEVNVTPQVSGRVVAISQAVRAGADFKADEILFEIDRSDYEVAVTRAEASLANARSSLLQTEAEAEVAIEEWQTLYPDTAIRSLAAYEPQLEAARGQVLSAEADLADARLDLQRTRYSLPFDGRVSDSQIEIGTVVSAGQSYGTAYDYTALELVVPIAPSDLGRLQGAQDREVAVTIEGTNFTYTGQVERVGARLDERTRFVNLYVHFDSTDRIIQPGLFADVLIEGPEYDAVMRLPSEATPGLDDVYLVDNGVIRSQALTIIDRTQDTLYVEPFDYRDGVVISALPANALGREADIVSVNGEDVR